MICLICKLPFYKDTVSGTCSRSCNATFQNKQKAQKFQPNKCLICGKSCKRQAKYKYCSISCQHLGWRGDGHYKWKGGKHLRKDGYIEMVVHNHPFSDNNNRLLEHRFVVEKHLLSLHKTSNWLILHKGQKVLKRNLVIHHLNGNKQDNRLSNLYVCDSQSEHQDIEQNRKIVKESNILGAKSGY